MARDSRRPGRTLIGFFVGLAITFGLVALAGSWTPTLGLDLQGGTRITLIAEGSPSEENLAEAAAIIDQRVNGSGVSEAEVTTQGNEFVIVEIPGTSRRDLVETVERQAQLRFRLVACSSVDQRCGGAPTPTQPGQTTPPGGTPSVPSAPVGARGHRHPEGRQEPAAGRLRPARPHAPSRPSGERHRVADRGTGRADPAGRRRPRPTRWCGSTTPTRPRSRPSRSTSARRRARPPWSRTTPTSRWSPATARASSTSSRPPSSRAPTCSPPRPPCPQQQVDWVVTLDFDGDGTEDLHRDLARALQHRQAVRDRPRRPGDLGADDGRRHHQRAAPRSAATSPRQTADQPRDQPQVRRPADRLRARPAGRDRRARRSPATSSRRASSPAPSGCCW